MSKWRRITIIRREMVQVRCLVKALLFDKNFTGTGFDPGAVDRPSNAESVESPIIATGIRPIAKILDKSIVGTDFWSA